MGGLLDARRAYNTFAQPTLWSLFSLTSSPIQLCSGGIYGNDGSHRARSICDLLVKILFLRTSSLTPSLHTCKYFCFLPESGICFRFRGFKNLCSVPPHLLGFLTKQYIKGITTFPIVHLLLIHGERLEQMMRIWSPNFGSLLSPVNPASDERRLSASIKNIC